MALPAPFPGWLLEPGGDAWPRGMTVTPQGAQDPAYRPTPLLFAIIPDGGATSNSGTTRLFAATWLYRPSKATTTRHCRCRTTILARLREGPRSRDAALQHRRITRGESGCAGSPPMRNGMPSRSTAGGTPKSFGFKDLGAVAQKAPES